MSMATRLGRLVTYGLSKSCDKLKILFFYYQIVYGHQTWQDFDLPWWNPAHKGA